MTTIFQATTATDQAPATAAAATTQPRPSPKVVGGAYAGVVVAALLAWWANHAAAPDPPVLAEGMTALVLLLLLAQAIERVLEPVVRLTVSSAPTAARDQAVAAALTAPQDDARASTAANAQAAVDRQRANVAVVVWAAATALGMGISALTGVYLLRSLGVEGLNDLPAIEVVVTGLVIGAGTKPLHDLISRIDEAKRAAKDPPGTA